MNKIYQKMKEKVKNYNFLFFLIVAIRSYSIYFLNKLSNYQLEKITFYKKVRYRLNLKKPKSFNEKLVWKKIYDRNPLLPVTADKYRVRSYIKEILGEDKAKDLLIPLLYVTDKPETIPFEKFPSAFIVKPNHASGLKIIVEDGHFNKKEIIKTCRRWIKTPYGMEKLEWAYHSIKRKIVVEKLLREEKTNILKEYLFHMFHGKCKLILLIYDRMNNFSMGYYDEKWNILPVKKPNRRQAPKIKKPKNFKTMLRLAEKLSKPFDFIRVDLFNLNGKIYIGELTHYPDSGVGKYDPISFSYELGKNWKIESKYWQNK